MSDAPSASDPLAALSSGHVMHCDCDIQGVGGAPRNNTDPACAELQRGLAAYVRHLEGERARLEEIALHHQAEQKRLETANDRLTVQHAERGKVNADLNKRLQRAERQYTNSQRTVAEVTKAFEDAEGRLRDLEAALQRLAGHHHAVTHTGRYETCETAICREAREALSPPGPTQVAPAAEPPRADDDPRGA